MTACAAVAAVAWPRGGGDDLGARSILLPTFALHAEPVVDLQMQQQEAGLASSVAASTARGAPQGTTVACRRDATWSPLPLSLPPQE